MTGTGEPAESVMPSRVEAPTCSLNLIWITALVGSPEDPFAGWMNSTVGGVVSGVVPVVNVETAQQNMLLNDRSTALLTRNE